MKSIKLKSINALYAIHGSADILDQIADTVDPFLEPVPLSSAGDCWSIHIEETGSVSPGPDSEPNVDWQVADRRVNIVGSSNWVSTFTNRYIRTLDRIAAMMAGWRPVHGAAVTVAGRGVVIVGDKFAGKTTAALSLVRSRGGEFISNDDTMLALTDRVRAMGTSRSIGVRIGSLAEHRPALPLDDLARAARLHPANVAVPTAEKIFLSPSELPAIGGRAAPTMRVDALVELRCSTAAAGVMHRIPAGQAAELVEKHVERYPDRNRHGFISDLGISFPSMDDTAQLISHNVDIFEFDHPRSGWVEQFLREMDKVMFSAVESS
ncbi:hypothetical protein [Nocardia arthritidis]|uniref:hypothetical protein n=1 Tax=Nocardia arthritidis TaxID=228602 RepID=UPI0007A3DDA8|nr:hypothetical protein [Nocardia arthritidis]